MHSSLFQGILLRHEFRELIHDIINSVQDFVFSLIPGIS